MIKPVASFLLTHCACQELPAGGPSAPIANDVLLMVILQCTTSSLVSPERNQIQAHQQCSSVTQDSKQTEGKPVSKRTLPIHKTDNVNVPCECHLNVFFNNSYITYMQLLPISQSLLPTRLKGTQMYKWKSRHTAAEVYLKLRQAIHTWESTYKWYT